VRIFHWNGKDWLQTGADIDGEYGGDESGWSVSMPDAHTVAIGAILNAENGFYIGQARVYTYPSVGIIENSFADKLVIYPNPSNGMWLIDLGDTQDNVSVNISDLNGRIYFSKSYYNKGIITMDTRYLRAGAYIVEVRAKEGNAVLKLVKK